MFAAGRLESIFPSTKCGQSPRISKDDPFRDFLLQIIYGNQQQTATSVLELHQNSSMIIDLKDCLKLSSYTHRNFAEIDTNPDGVHKRRDSMTLLFNNRSLSRYLDTSNQTFTQDHQSSASHTGQPSTVTHTQAVRDTTEADVDVYKP